MFKKITFNPKKGEFEDLFFSDGEGSAYKNIMDKIKSSVTPDKFGKPIAFDVYTESWDEGNNTIRYKVFLKSDAINQAIDLTDELGKGEFIDTAKAETLEETLRKVNDARSSLGEISDLRYAENLDFIGHTPLTDSTILQFKKNGKYCYILPDNEVVTNVSKKELPTVKIKEKISPEDILEILKIGHTGGYIESDSEMNVQIYDPTFWESAKTYLKMSKFNNPLFEELINDIYFKSGFLDKKIKESASRNKLEEIVGRKENIILPKKALMVSSVHGNINGENLDFFYRIFNTFGNINLEIGKDYTVSKEDTARFKKLAETSMKDPAASRRYEFGKKYLAGDRKTAVDDVASTPTVENIHGKIRITSYSPNVKITGDKINLRGNCPAPKKPKYEIRTAGKDVTVEYRWDKK